jgi:hypothetical protein
MTPSGWIAIAAGVQAAATVVLVCVTGTYVRHTRGMVVEMRAQREQDAALERRRRSEAAAARAREALLDSDFTSLGAQPLSRRVLAATRRELESSAPLIDDAAVARAVDVCAGVMRTIVTESQNAPSYGLALVGRRAAESLRLIIEAYLGNRELPETDDLPESRAELPAWVVERAGRYSAG